MSKEVLYIIDVESGNLQSLQNAIEHLGCEIKYLKDGFELQKLVSQKKQMKLILPGVGNYGHFVKQLYNKNFRKPILEYIELGNPLFGICVGLQALFKSSSEDEYQSAGLDFVSDTSLTKFDSSSKSVPQIGWNHIDSLVSSEGMYGLDLDKKFYFVHSYAAILADAEIETLRKKGYDLALGKYGEEKFIAAVSKGNVFATQFHPEKSGIAGINLLREFLNGNKNSGKLEHPMAKKVDANLKTLNGLTYRIIACLDVRSNDQGDLVVTKGDQYDVREKDSENKIRNLGKPVKLAEKYYLQGADEVTFLNITSFKNSPLQDLPMLEVLKEASKTVFVPLTVGGGIKDFVQPSGEVISSLHVAELYFKSGADKVSIGSDAVYTVEKYFINGEKATGDSPIELISKSYGVQAVVISVDPRRKYVKSPSDAINSLGKPIKTFKTKFSGPNSEEYVYYEVSMKGGREFSAIIGAYELVTIAEKLGAGEILLNCIDKDGSNSGFDLELVDFIKKSVRIPVIASSGAGKPEHFLEVFEATGVDAALGAGMFHRGEYEVNDVKQYLNKHGYSVRM